MKKVGPLLMTTLLLGNVLSSGFVEASAEQEEATSASVDSSETSSEEVEEVPAVSSSETTETASSTETTEESSIEESTAASTEATTEETDSEATELLDVETDDLDFTNNLSVGTANDFKSAWENATCDSITLTGNIDINFPMGTRSTPITIIGSGYQLGLAYTFFGGDANLKNSAGNTITLKDISINNGISWGSRVTPLLGGSFVMDGNVSVISVGDKDAMKLDGDLTVTPGSTFKVTSDKTALTNSTTTGNIQIGEGANFVVTGKGGDGITRFKNFTANKNSQTTIAPASGSYGLSFNDRNSNLLLESGAKLTISSGSNPLTNLAASPAGTLTVKDGASLIVTANGEGVKGFQTTTIGSPSGTGGTVYIVAPGGSGFTGTGSNASLTAYQGSHISIYASSGSGIENIGTAKFENVTGVASSTGGIGIKNVTNLQLDKGTTFTINGKQAGISNTRNLTMSGATTKTTIQSSGGSGIETGDSFLMSEGAALDISATTAGITGITEVSVVNTKIVSNGTYKEGNILTGQVVWANLNYGITGGTNVTLGGNVKIGTGDTSISSGGSASHDRTTSPKKRAVSASNAVVMNGDGNYLYGGGVSSASSLEAAVEAKTVTINGNQNIVMANQAETATSTAIKTTDRLLVAGDHNIIFGKTYGVVSSSGGQETGFTIDITGNNNTFATLEQNAIDTNALAVNVSGNQNQFKGIVVGILNWRSTQNTVNISGYGTKVYGTDITNGVAINTQKNTLNGIVTISGTSNSPVQNEIIGTKNAISTNTEGTVSIGGNTLVKSYSNMTVIGKYITFTEGNVILNYEGLVSEGGAYINPKKSVLWVGQKADMAGSYVHVEHGADVKMYGFGYLESEDGNSISSPIHSSYENVDIKDGGTLYIESEGNAINWYHDKPDTGDKTNRGFATYTVRSGGTLSLKSRSTNPKVSVVQKLAGETSYNKGAIVVESNGGFLAEGSGGYIFDLPVGTTFELTNPRVLDLKNTAKRPVFSKASSNGNTTFKINKTNISLWNLDTDLGTTETTPDYAYDDVGFMNVLATGSTLILTTDHSQFANDFRDSDSMSNISRIRAEVKGKSLVYYEKNDGTQVEFVPIWEENPNIRYGDGTSVDTILKTMVKDASGNNAHYRYQELESGISQLKPLINKYTFASRLPVNGVQQYFEDFHGMTWDEASMTAFENWKADFPASNIDGLAVYDNPVLKLTKVPFRVNVTTTVDEPGSTTTKLLSGEYGDMDQTFSIEMRKGYTCMVKVNGGATIVLKEDVTLPLVFNEQTMTATTHTDLDDVWQWQFPTDDTLQMAGTIDVTVSYIKGESLLQFGSIPSIDFGHHKISNEAATFSAASLSGDFTVIDTYSTPRVWNITGKITTQATDTLGTFIKFDNVVLDDTSLNKITDSQSLSREADVYTILSQNERNRLQLDIPALSQLKDKKYDYTVTFYLNYTP